MSPPRITPLPPATAPDPSGRVWPALFVSAGYPSLQLGPVPLATSPLIGVHATPSGPITVSFQPVGVSGNPELQLLATSGAALTVLDEQTANAYLATGLQ